MKAGTLMGMSVEALVKRFTELSQKQVEAELLDDHAAFNRLYDEIDRVQKELRGRDGDQRTALLELYAHPNMQVRLNAVKFTLAVAPLAGRKMLEDIAASHHFPQAGDAGMCLWALDEGIFVPK